MQVDQRKVIGKYEVIKKIGEGSYGTVYQAIDPSNNSKKVAIKEFKDLFSEFPRVHTWQKVLREIEILISLRNNQFIQTIYDILLIVDHNSTNQKLYIVTEYSECDLRKLTIFYGSLTMKQVKTIFYNILCGIKYMHSGEIIHRDLAPSNIMVNSDLSVRVIDFGLSRSCITKQKTPDPSSNISLLFSLGDLIEKRNEERRNLDQFGYAADHKYGSGATKAMEEYKVPGKEERKKDWVKENVIGLKNTTTSKTNSQTPEPMGSQTTEVDNLKYILTSVNDKENGLECLDILSEYISLHFQEKLIESLPTMGRENSGYIGTRWYRAPEVILIEKYMLKASDMWSLGCILAELLRCVEGSEYLKKERKGEKKAIFAGDSCFPMSPRKQVPQEETVKIGNYQCSAQDQLLLILKTIGSPKLRDLELFSDPNAKKYLSNFQFKAQDLNDLFPHLHREPEGPLDLLKKLLRFQPFERFTASMALRHPFLNEVRDRNQEKSFSLWKKDLFESEQFVNLTPEYIQANTLDLREQISLVSQDFPKIVKDSLSRYEIEKRLSIPQIKTQMKDLNINEGEEMGDIDEGPINVGKLSRGVGGGAGMTSKMPTPHNQKQRLTKDEERDIIIKSGITLISYFTKKLKEKKAEEAI